MKTTKWLTAALTTLLLAGAVSSSAFAFQDLKDVQGADKIQELRERGIVSGIGNERFAPHAAMSAQQAISLIVKGLKLNMDHVKFVKEPQASDYFTQIPNDAWYAEAFIIAHVNGLPIDADIQPDAAVTREQFAQWLTSAIHTKGEYALIMMYVMFEDEDEVTDGYMGAIQELLLCEIAKLDKDQNFRPQDAITRAEAAVMVRNAIEFVEDVKPIPPMEEKDPIAAGEVGATVENVTDEVQKVTLDWGEKPHPGWNISIAGIDFTEDQGAVIRYKLHVPDVDAIYPMVITYPKAETYLDARITNIRFELVP